MTQEIDSKVEVFLVSIGTARMSKAVQAEPTTPNI